MERAQLGIVGDVAPHAGLLGVVKHCRVGLSVVGGGEDQCPTPVDIRTVGTFLEIDFPAIGHLGQWRHDLGRHDRDPRPLLDQALDLAKSDAAAPHDQAVPASNIEHHRVQGRLHTAGAHVTYAGYKDASTRLERT